MSINKDKYWMQTADYVRKHCGNLQAVVAPAEFREVLNTGLRYDDANSSDLSAISTVVVHKDLLEKIDWTLLTQVATGWPAVFANEVFVVFNRNGRPLESDKHLRSFLEKFKQLAQSAGAAPASLKQLARSTVGPAPADSEHPVESAAATSSNVRQYYYLGRGRALTSLYTGYPFIVDTNDVGISTWIIRGGRWEPSIEQVIMAYCQPGNVFVDCGAHMGYYTVLCGQRVGPSGRVYSFEPNPHLFSILRDNIHINGLDNRCLPFNYALASASGSSKMWFEERYSGGGYLSKNPDVDRSADNFKSCQVTLKRLDQILPPDLQVDLMKVDVEGFEPEVFAGGWSIIERSPAIKLVVEMTPNAWRGNGVDPMDFLQRFLVYGFGFSLITDEGQVRVRGPEELIEQASAVPCTPCFIATR